MNSTLLDAPRLEEPGWARLISAGSGLWRVADERGRPLGHVRAVGSQDDRRYRAERFHAPTRSFRILGQFWASTEALECLRYSR